jgi:hypothetical protein
MAGACLVHCAVQYKPEWRCLAAVDLCACCCLLHLCSCVSFLLVDQHRDSLLRAEAAAHVCGAPQVLLLLWVPAALTWLVAGVCYGLATAV